MPLPTMPLYNPGSRVASIRLAEKIVEDYANTMEGKSLSARSLHAALEPQTNPRRQSRKPATSRKNTAAVLYDGRPNLQGQHEQLPLFNNRSLSMLSAMHHLNPHRKVAMSPEVLRDAEEQASTLKKTIRQLQDQLEKTNREKARMQRFLTDLLYTLNARGYESVQDHEGTLVDLNKCKGETYLDLRGRDLKQRVNVRRPGGQEFLLKAVIGNQERAIQSLVYKLDVIGRDIILDNRLSIESCGNGKSSYESTKISSLEAEVFQLINLIEGACQKCPEVYSALRDFYFLNEGGETSELNPRNPVIQNLLKKCEQIAGEAQSKQLLEMLSKNGISSRPKSEPSQVVLHQTNEKPVKQRSSSKSKSKTRNPKTVSSEVIATTNLTWNVGESMNVTYNRPASGSDTGGHLKPLNGGSKSESSFHNKHSSSTRQGKSVHSSNNMNSAGEPTSTYSN